MTALADLLDLVRAPAILTVIGDTLVGATNAGRRPGARALGLSASSACLYAAGMALNDYADADLDALERPERPIPSGRVSRSTALATGVGLTAAGVGLAFTTGRAAGLVSLAIAGAVWSYDLAAKPTRWGPVVMGLCRGLDVMMGAAGTGWRGAVPAAALVAAHTTAVTVLSRGEVHGTTPLAAASSVATTAAIASASVTGAGWGDPATLLGTSAYVAATLPSQIDAVRTGDAAAARTATRQGIRAMIPLQTALVARAGSASATGALTAVAAIVAVLGRRRTRGDVT